MKNKKTAETDLLIVKMLNSLGDEKILNYLLLSFQEDLKTLDNSIRDEQVFAKENPPHSTYGFAGTEARQRVKYLKRIRKERVLLNKKFNLCIKMKTRIDKMW
jgi:hypothetical protein